MSKMSNLANVLDEMNTCGSALIRCANEMKTVGENLVRISEEIKNLFTEEAQTDTAVSQEPAEQEKTYSFTEVRGTLASKSREGFKNKIKALLTKYGADKLSDVAPENYAALMADVGALHHE